MNLHSAFAAGALGAATLASQAMAQVGPVPQAPPTSSLSQAELLGRGVRPAEFGTRCCEILQIPASSFVPRDSNVEWAYDSGGYLYVTSTITMEPFWAAVTLPAGAVIVFLNLYYDDDDPVHNIHASLDGYPGWDETNSTIAPIISVSSSGNPGREYAFSNSISHTVNNDVRYGGGSQYTLRIILSGAVSTLKFKAVDIWWYRQVSPAPASASFGDVPASHEYFRFIEALAAAGVTSGCAGGNFCPSSNVTRGEMAVFLAKALGLYWQSAVELRP